MSRSMQTTKSTTRMEPRLAFRVRPETLDELRALAQREETTVGSLVRRALRMLLAEARRHDTEKTP